MAIQLINTETNETIAFVPIVGDISTIPPSAWVTLVETFLSEVRKLNEQLTRQQRHMGLYTPNKEEDE
jgi:hypothetical protein